MLMVRPGQLPPSWVVSDVAASRPAALTPRRAIRRYVPWGVQSHVGPSLRIVPAQPWWCRLLSAVASHLSTGIAVTESDNPQDCSTIHYRFRTCRNPHHRSSGQHLLPQFPQPCPTLDLRAHMPDLCACLTTRLTAAGGLSEVLRATQSPRRWSSPVAAGDVHCSGAAQRGARAASNRQPWRPDTPAPRGPKKPGPGQGPSNPLPTWIHPSTRATTRNPRARTVQPRVTKECGRTHPTGAPPRLNNPAGCTRAIRTAA